MRSEESKTEQEYMIKLIMQTIVAQKGEDEIIQVPTFVATGKQGTNQITAKQFSGETSDMRSINSNKQVA